MSTLKFSSAQYYCGAIGYFCCVQIPLPLIRSLKDIKGFDENLFKDAHTVQNAVASIRLNTMKATDVNLLWDTEIEIRNVPWCSTGFVVSPRPSFTFHPLFHAGAYYVQEASSMFLEQALKQCVPLEQPLKLLDLCAAPGGKSTHLQSLISDQSLLVCNEVIRSRSAVLQENIIKWGANNVVVTQNDPKDFSMLEGYFDAMIVDAPCSGSGLFRRDAKAIDAWSENNVMLCNRRQQRILADALPALKQNGILIYSTCSYSPQENEDIVNWLCHSFNMEVLPLKYDESWNITEVKSRRVTAYRFWPHLMQGEGFFLAVLKKTTGTGSVKNEKLQLKPVGAMQRAAAEQWARSEGQIFFQFGQMLYAWPDALQQDFMMLAKKLNVIYSGTAIGTFAHNKLIPAHALAMSPSLQAERIRRVSLTHKDAIAYLQRKDFSIAEQQRGWQLMSFNGQNLGWANILAQRINNYYPKALRILKD